MLAPLLYGASAAALLALTRLFFLLTEARDAKPRARQSSETCSLAVFLGSGGHTSEAIMLASALDFDRYRPRTYIISEGDALSRQKAIALEAAKAAGLTRDLRPVTSAHPAYSFVVIPRARRVHQSLLTTPLSAAYSLAACLWLVAVAPLRTGAAFADVLLLNGPGTCFVLCLANYLNRFCGLPSARMIYVESFARVRHLSLSGKLLRPIVDSFIVQWPDLLQDGKRGKYRGWLV